MSESSRGEPPPLNETNTLNSVVCEKMDDIDNLNECENEKVVNKNANDKHRLNRYRKEDAGPYFIFVEHKYLNVGNLHPMKLGIMLEQLGEYDKYIKEISSVGRNRVKIEVSSPLIANDLVSHQFFTDNNYIAYVPQHYIEKKGIIRMVDTSFSEEIVLKKIHSNVPVKSIKRIYRLKDKNNKDSGLIATQTIIVTFMGSKLPDYIFISKVRYEVQTYIPPVIQCFKCFIYGHTANQCRSKEQRCHKCSEIHEGVCEDGVFCYHCEDNSHSSLSKSCPVYIKQQKIKKIMTQYNISFKEAEKVYHNPTYANCIQNNRYAPLLDNNLEFPSLPPSQQHPTSQITTSRRVVQSQPPVSKKRKAPTSPNFPPPQREFPFSFCGPPIKNNPHSTKNLERNNDFTEVKNEITQGIIQLLQNIFTNIGIKNLDFQGLTNNVVISINDIFSNIHGKQNA